MDILSPLIVLAGVVVWLIMTIRQNNYQRRQLPVAAAEKPKALEVWVEDHRLVRTWKATVQENRPGIAAWAWKCSCGVTGSAGDAKEFTSLGSEANAIERFKSHAKGYREANKGVINPLATKLDKVEADFAEYRQKCYCKTTNDDLILLERKLDVR